MKASKSARKYRKDPGGWAADWHARHRRREVKRGGGACLDVEEELRAAPLAPAEEVQP
uniref:Uncharacterized protein n=1 Tax=viral metagenome TaxID=1070528 RepID=A0A6M3M8J4_9ZZZZ